MPSKTISELQQELDIALHQLSNLEPGNTTRHKYARFKLKNTIQKCKIQIRQTKIRNRARNVRAYYSKRNTRVVVQKLYTDITYQDLGYTSALEVRTSTFAEAVQRCFKKYKKERLTIIQATDIVRLLDERSGFLLGKDK